MMNYIVNVKSIANRNIDELKIECAEEMVCDELLNRCKLLLQINDDKKYTLSRRGVFFNDTDFVSAGKLELSLYVE